MESNFSPAQQTILDAIADGEDGKASLPFKASTLSSCKALESRGVIEFEQNGNVIEVSLVAEKKGSRKVWDLTLARDEHGVKIPLDDDGKMTAVPHNFPKGFYPLMKGQFTEPAMQLDWLAVEADRRATEHNERADAYRRKAREAREGASPETMLEKIKARRAKAEEKFAAEEAALLEKIGNGEADSGDEY